MDKWRGRETQLALCHQALSQYSVININRSPPHPRGRLVRLFRVIDAGFHNPGNWKIQAEGLRKAILSGTLSINKPRLVWERGWWVPSWELTAQGRYIHPRVSVPL